MGRKSLVIDKEELIEKLKELPTQNDVAEYFDCSQGTISNKVREYDIGPKLVMKTKKREGMELPEFSYDDLKKTLTQLEDRAEKSIGYNEVDIEIETERPIGILPLQDFHIGARYVFYRRLFESVDTIVDHPFIFTTLNGDYADNYNTSAYKAGQIEQAIPIQEQKASVESIIKRLAPSTLSIINGCFLEGTPVVADDYTMKPIETINRVLGKEESYDVKKHWQNNYHSGDICRISYLGNTVFNIPATNNHPFVGLKRENIQCPYRENGRFCKGINVGKFCNDRCKNKPIIKPETILAGDLEVGDFVYIPKPKDPKGNKFTTEDMEIFGWYLAEGSTIPEKAVTIFTLGITERKQVERLQELIETHHSDKISSTTLIERKKKNVQSLRVYGKEFAEWICKYCGRYSHSKKLHIDVINESNEKLAKLVDCFRLGDGHTRDDYGLDITLTTISEDLAWQLWHVLLRIGQFASIRQQERKNRDYDDFQINYRPERKQFRYCETENGYFVPIINIETENYDGIVKNLWIESEEHLYRAGGCLQRNCHDEWSYLNDGFDFAQYLANKSLGYYMGHNGLIHLKVGNITYDIFVTHNTYRNSTINPGHGLASVAKEGVDFDIGVGAHVHKPHFEQRVIRGELKTLVIGGAFKGQDRYASKSGFPPLLGITPGFILNPVQKQVLGHMNYKEAFKYL